MNIGQDPWSSGYGRKLMFQRLWVQIPTQYTGLTFFHILFVVKIEMCVWKDENKRKRDRGWHIFNYFNFFEPRISGIGRDRCTNWTTTNFYDILVKH